MKGQVNSGDKSKWVGDGPKYSCTGLALTVENVEMMLQKLNYVDGLVNIFCTGYAQRKAYAIANTLNKELPKYKFQVLLIPMFCGGDTTWGLVSNNDAVFSAGDGTAYNEGDPTWHMTQSTGGDTYTA